MFNASHTGTDHLNFSSHAYIDMHIIFKTM